MEYKHFSHNHGLVFHQMPHGTEIQCSGCKSPGSGSAYVCWQCNYFLHEQCFQASRSLKHPSHPIHPLTLVPYPTYPSNSFFCNSCNQVGNGFSYSCSECEFDLHVHCAHSATAHEALPHFPYPNYSNLPQKTQFNPQQPFLIPQSTQSNYNIHSTPNYATSNQAGSYDSVQHNPSHIFPPHYSASPQAVNYESIQHNATAIPPEYVTAPPASSYASFQQNSRPNLPQINATNLNYDAPASVASTQAPLPPVQAAHVPLTTNQAKPEVVSAPVPRPSQPVCISLLSQPRKQEVKHFSHPHPLNLQEITGDAPKYCSGCEDELSGSVYCCIESQCDFKLHDSCYKLPLEIHHKSHVEHPLTLLGKPPSNYTDGQFTCNACIQNGAAFVYNCSTCSFDLHVECVSLPESIIRPDHKHPLKLFYTNPVPAEDQQQEVTFVCDVCQKPVHQIAWTYYCHECDFGTHLECAAFEVRPPEKSEAELIRETELKLAVLQLLMNGGSGAVTLTKS